MNIRRKIAAAQKALDSLKAELETYEFRKPMLIEDPILEGLVQITRTAKGIEDTVFGEVYRSDVPVQDKMKLFKLPEETLHLLAYGLKTPTSLTEAPEALTALCECLSRFPLSGAGVNAYAVPYNSHDRRPEWRIVIRDKSDHSMLIDWLVPSYASGHTYMLMVRRIREINAAGILEGKQQSVQAMVRNMCVQLSIPNLLKE